MMGLKKSGLSQKGEITLALLAIIAAAAGLVAGVLAVRAPTALLPKAGVSDEPLEIRVYCQKLSQSLWNCGGNATSYSGQKLETVTIDNYDAKPKTLRVDPGSANPFYAEVSDDYNFSNPDKAYTIYAGATDTGTSRRTCSLKNTANGFVPSKVTGSEFSVTCAHIGGAPPPVGTPTPTSPPPPGPGEPTFTPTPTIAMPDTEYCTTDFCLVPQKDGGSYLKYDNTSRQFSFKFKVKRRGLPRSGADNGQIYVSGGDYALGFDSPDFSQTNFTFTAATGNTVSPTGGGLSFKLKEGFYARYCPTTSVNISVRSTFSLEELVKPTLVILHPPECGSPPTNTPTPTATVTPGCVSNADCNDDNSCTNDVCNVNHFCQNLAIPNCPAPTATNTPTPTRMPNAGGGTGTIPLCNATIPLNLRVADITMNSASLSWLPGQNGAKQILVVGINAFDVEAGCPNRNCFYFNDNLSVANNTYTFNGTLAPSTEYFWRVINYKNESCQRGASSNFYTLPPVGGATGGATRTPTVSPSESVQSYAVSGQIEIMGSLRQGESFQKVNVVLQNQDTLVKKETGVQINATNFGWQGAYNLSVPAGKYYLQTDIAIKKPDGSLVGIPGDQITFQPDCGGFMRCPVTVSSGMTAPKIVITLSSVACAVPQDIRVNKGVLSPSEQFVCEVKVRLQDKETKDIACEVTDSAGSLVGNLCGFSAVAADNWAVFNCTAPQTTGTYRLRGWNNNQACQTQARMMTIEVAGGATATPLPTATPAAGKLKPNSLNEALGYNSENKTIEGELRWVLPTEHSEIENQEVLITKPASDSEKCEGGTLFSINALQLFDIGQSARSVRLDGGVRVLEPEQSYCWNVTVKYKSGTTVSLVSSDAKKFTTHKPPRFIFKVSDFESYIRDNGYDCGNKSELKLVLDAWDPGNDPSRPTGDPSNGYSLYWPYNEAGSVQYLPYYFNPQKIMYWAKIVKGNDILAELLGEDMKADEGKTYSVNPGPKEEVIKSVCKPLAPPTATPSPTISFVPGTISGKAKVEFEDQFVTEVVVRLWQTDLNNGIYSFKEQKIFGNPVSGQIYSYNFDNLEVSKKYAVDAYASTRGPSSSMLNMERCTGSLSKDGFRCDEMSNSGGGADFSGIFPSLQTSCNSIDYALKPYPVPQSGKVSVNISRTHASSCRGNWDNVGLKMKAENSTNWINLPINLCFSDGSHCDIGYNSSFDAAMLQSGVQILQFTVNNGQCLCNPYGFRIGDSGGTPAP